MAIFYSASKGAFFDDTIHASIPSDKVEITIAEYNALIEAQNNGYLIVAGDGGKPTTLKQECGVCTKTQHEQIVASADTLGHVKLDDAPTAGSNNAVSSAGIKTALTKADAGVVHLANDEKITGAKTFTASPIVERTNPSQILKATEANKGTTPTTTTSASVVAFDKGGMAEKNKLGGVAVEYNTDGSISSSIKAYKPESGSTETASVAVVCKADGTKYATAPTPPANDKTNKIATTEWVKGITDTFDGNKFLPKTGGTMTGDVVFDKGISSASVKMANNLVSLILRGGTSYDDGGTIALYGAGTNKQGEVDIVAHDGTNARTLNIKADGSLVWYGKNIVRSINNTNANADGNVTLDTGVTSFNGSKGAVTYTAPVTSVNGKTGAVTLTIPATPKTYVSAYSNSSGTSGYRKWSDGTIENWGVISFNAGNTKTFTFPLAFATNCTVQMSVQTTDDMSAVRFYIESKTKTTVTMYCSVTGSVHVYAFGK